MSTIVHAVIVEKPNKELGKWIKAIVFTHGAFSLYTVYSYKLHHVPEYKWWSLLISWMFLGVLIPMMGLRASETTDKRRLNIFSGIQAFIAVCNAVNFLAFTSVLIQVMDWCGSRECAREFARNGSCAVVFANETVMMDESYCGETNYNIGTAFGFALLAFTSCMGSMQARKMNEVKLAEVTYVQPVSVRVPIPEDVDEEMAVVEEYEVMGTDDEGTTDD